MVKIIRKSNEGIRRTLGELKQKHVKLGFFEQSRYPDGTPIAYVAAIQEFGSPKNNIPSRSFMRTTQNEKKKGWASNMGSAVKAAFNGADLHQGLEALALSAAGDIKKTISSIASPALADSTLYSRRHRKERRTNSTKPLVDSGVLIDSVEGKVENK